MRIPWAYRNEKYYQNKFFLVVDRRWVQSVSPPKYPIRPPTFDRWLPIPNHVVYIIWLAWLPWNLFFRSKSTKNNEFSETKRVFCSLFLSGSVKTIFRVKMSFGVILAILDHFCKTEEAHIGATSWTDIGSAWPPLSIFKKLARWHPMQKSYSRF